MMLAMAAAAQSARAQTILQQLVSPGALTAKHAKFESKCESCHASFDKRAQSTLCLDCHKEVAADVAGRRGFHGRIQPAGRPCSDCHTDHEGREKIIVEFEPKAFDHRQTDYPLRGRHAGVACASCHAPGRLYREAAADCVGCHKDDEPHRRQLGDKCQDCHTEADWKEIRFDHSKTDFALGGAHARAECSACHADEHYKDVAADCVSCHRDDDHHKGQLARCATCHNDVAWKEIRFDHSKTKFALTGAHVRTECEACHANDRYINVATTCASCHGKDDVHNARLGQNCGTCHTAANWNVGKFDHAKTKFALSGKHADIRCEACHLQPAAKVRLGVECESCHRKDDAHKGGFGPDCAQCHDAGNWKVAKFDHTKGTRFALAGKHATAACADCHQVGAATARIETACISCHADEDVHAKELANCAQCHNDRAWDVAVVFDHDLSRFPLIGKHADIACDQCHTSKRYKEAALPCADCHKDDDAHKTALGVKCGDCHNPIAWAAWSFDHDTQTRFALSGAHARVDCDDCHRPNQPTVTSLCIDCHRGDDAHFGRFGADCGRCHTASSFKELRNRF